ncbi:MAG: anaerobic ribonucleoside-triphosphate reductase activating protein [Patescibacteria group bacterium]
MLIGGLQKLTLIDYPGKLAATVFTVGCSFRCPFCHNPELVLGGGAGGGLPEEDFFRFLKTRKGKLEGVCITGGEPTIQKDLPDFIRKIKKLGFLVKLDTNGSRPDVLRNLLKEKLIDFVAMDIKGPLESYDKFSGVKTDKERIGLSVELIRHSRLPYEFRTTVVPGLHSEKDFSKIAKWLEGSSSYFLQVYGEGKILDPRLKKKTKGKTIDLEKIRKNILASFGKVEIRG